MDLICKASPLVIAVFNIQSWSELSPSLQILSNSKQLSVNLTAAHINVEYLSSVSIQNILIALLSLVDLTSQCFEHRTQFYILTEALFVETNALFLWMYLLI